MTVLTNMQPLEMALESRCNDTSKFPRTSINYFTQYCALVNKLRADIYPKIDAGLAANSAESGYYTAHDAEHFDEVVRYAGDLLNIESSNWNLLTPYELYVLLIAIRIHDVGNIHGRENHEKQCFKLLMDLGSLTGDDSAEKKIIATIAEAHGGETPTGDKDTIGILLDTERTITKITIRPRLLAGIVRFADELCENRHRAANHLLDHGRLPEQSQVYHQYANSIHTAHYNFQDKRVALHFCVKREYVAPKWGCGKRKRADGTEFTSTYIIDEILERIDKMNRERCYCNQYMRDVCKVDAIRSKIEIVNQEWEVIESINIPELKDTGYPASKKPTLKEVLEDYCGESYRNKFSDHDKG